MKIFLIGLMGSGKSFWTKKLGKKLKTGAYDLDFLVESIEELSVKEIFEQKGEDYFRSAETKMLRLFSQKKSFVLATGGGTPCFNDNMQWMNEQGITIWLDEDINLLAERLKPEKAHRPLIKDLDDGALEDFLSAKRKERLNFYEQATVHLKSSEISDAKFAAIIKQHA
ncbi:MAG: shikimate kinase [Chitinophagaceae bacterium]|nr:shikimate kinase [Chitinophagaceae bacterium]